MPEVLSHSIQFNGLPVRVWRGGSGPALLLMHGGMGDATLHWRPVWNLLAESFDVIAPDWPAFGGTARLKQVTFAALVDWSAALLSRLKIERATVVGNSFGGGVARLFAAKQPSRTTRLILVNGGAVPDIPGFLRGFFTSRLADPLFEMMRRQAFSIGSMKRMVADESILTPEFVAASQASSRGFVTAMREAAMSQTPRDRTPQVPTLVLWGAADRFASTKTGRGLAAAIPGAQFKLMESAGHMPQIERPEAFVRAVREFCG